MPSRDAALEIRTLAQDPLPTCVSASGAFYLQYFRYIDLHIAYGPAISVEALLAAIVGGMGTVFGPLLGAAVLHVLGEATRGLLEARRLSRSASASCARCTRFR